jgi:hypothetical protein
MIKWNATGIPNKVETSGINPMSVGDTCTDETKNWKQQ